MAYHFPAANTSGATSASIATSFVDEVSFNDFLELDDWLVDDVPDSCSFSLALNSSPDPRRIGSSYGATNDRISREVKEVRGDKIAFKTKSKIEVLDDGFKWRKYGKKMVKNSPNPRNYYKCSVEGCPVKKRVERDNVDRRYVVTTYEGIHIHEGPQSS